MKIKFLSSFEEVYGRICNTCITVIATLKIPKDTYLEEASLRVWLQQHGNDDFVKNIKTKTLYFRKTTCKSSCPKVFC